ncbi:MAG: hypothetical protein PVH29_08100 [Candidatus Zixiibacteriota bacterium]|jgi:hypothetical protein
MKRVADVFILLGFLAWAVAIVTRLASRDFIFPMLQLPAQTYLDFGWTSFIVAAVLLLRQIRDK